MSTPKPTRQDRGPANTWFSACRIEHFRPDTTPPERIQAFLQRIAYTYIPPLTQQVAIPDYAAKLARYAEVLFASIAGSDVGLLTLYANDTVNRTAFVSTLGIAPEHTSRGIGGGLMQTGIALAWRIGMHRVRFEIDRRNERSLRLHLHLGFLPVPPSEIIVLSNPNAVLLELSRPEDAVTMDSTLQHTP
jgi:GNAT superfamily N-acetyltransferase